MRISHHKASKLPFQQHIQQSIFSNPVGECYLQQDSPELYPAKGGYKPTPAVTPKGATIADIVRLRSYETSRWNPSTSMTGFLILAYCYRLIVLMVTLRSRSTRSFNSRIRAVQGLESARRDETYHSSISLLYLLFLQPLRYQSKLTRLCLPLYRCVACPFTTMERRSYPLQHAFWRMEGPGKLQEHKGRPHRWPIWRHLLSTCLWR